METLNGLVKEVFDQNPWWEIKANFRFEEAKYPNRLIFSDLLNALEYRQIVSLTGLRRIGKSTLIKQCLNHVLEKKIQDPKHCLYFNFDKAFIDRTEDALVFVLDQYFERVLGQKVHEITEKVFLFLDEVQYIKLWSDVLKRYYDKNKNLKFIITGSCSTELSQASYESLAGRIIEYKLDPLAFEEYLSIKKNDPNFTKAKLELNDLEQDYDEQFTKLSNFYHYYQSYFDEFLLCGQFPELLDFEDSKQKYDYINESILEKIIAIDLPQIFDVNNITDLKRIARSLFQDSSSIYEINNIASDLGIDRHNCSRYKEILELSSLVTEIYTYSKSARKAARTLKKIYANSMNFTASLMKLNFETHSLNEYLGKLAETYVLQKLKSKFEYISFYRDGQNEIDFLVGSLTHKSKSELLAVEVKYQKTIRKKDLNFAMRFCKAQKIPQLIVVTKNRFETEKLGDLKIYYLPVCVL